MVKVYKRTSHLRQTPIRNGYTELYVPPIVPDFTQTKEFIITQRYVRRPDLHAYELYGESDFWWVFPLYNNNLIVDPINATRDFVAGI